MNMRTMLETVASKNPEKLAMIDERTQLTFAQFLQRTYRLGNALHHLHFYHGDRIAILMKNRSEYCEIYFGVSGMGGIVVPLNTRLGLAEISYILRHSGATALVYEDVFGEVVQQIKLQEKGLKHFICVGKPDEDYNYEDLIQEGSHEPPMSEALEEDVAFLCYTSGTTGYPKGAMITHKNVVTMCSNQLVELPRNRDEIGMVLFPFFHIGVVTAFNKISNGITSVYCDFEPHKVAGFIQKYRISDVEIPATQLRIFVNTKGIEHYDISSLKVMMTGGGFSSIDTLRKLFNLFNPDHDLRVANVYGMTENTAHVMSNVITPNNIGKAIEKMETLPGIKASGLGAGKPIYGIQARVVNEDGQPVAVNTVGEIVVKGDTVMKGYWQQPKITSEVLRNGWYHTGDLGLQLEDGDFFVIDRKNYKIVTGDENVYPAEVESVLREHPAIQDVAVIGVPDEKWMEIVKAVVVLVPEASVTEEELKGFCQGKIANYKIPKSFDFIDKLPVNAAGKVLKHQLKSRPQAVGESKNGGRK
ncbi:class I adenylate-forming enzyme family protein [Brevibacillus choshinensis]|uniref:class I adenylate-forming enzyme family protein n=1 Tax=Brevibacillus choshinensis TaxID=54911 RepID=UPI002E22B11E|nr:AMP-binding protein [Brevibacillus choshinensis]